jgi:hypothetical protein
MPDTVWVACKLPNGLLAETADITFEDIAGNKVATKRNVRQVVFRGSAQQRILENAGQTLGEAPLVIGGYGLTEVPADFWERWIEENTEYAPVKAGLIFAASKVQNVRAEAKEKARLRSGQEAIAPPNVDAQGKPVGEVDPRLPRGGGARVVTADKVV